MSISLGPVSAGRNNTGNTVTNGSTTGVQALKDKAVGIWQQFPFVKDKRNIPVLVTDGPDGSGAHYIGAGLAKNFGLEFISISALLEKYISELNQGNVSDQARAKELKRKQDSAEYVDDDTINFLIERKLSSFDKDKVSGFVFEGIVTPKRARFLRELGPRLGLFRQIDRMVRIFMDPRSAYSIVSEIKNCVNELCGKFNIPYLKPFEPDKDGKCYECHSEIKQTEHNKSLAKRFWDRLEEYVKNRKKVIKEFRKPLWINSLNLTLNPVKSTWVSVDPARSDFELIGAANFRKPISDEERKAYIERLINPAQALQSVTGILESELDLKRLSDAEINSREKAKQNENLHKAPKQVPLRIGGTGNVFKRAA